MMRFYDITIHRPSFYFIYQIEKLLLLEAHATWSSTWCTTGWHATTLHLLGLDHQQLTYRHAGRDYRLTDVHGNVAHDIIA